MKKMALILLIVAFAASSAIAVDGGNPKKGKYLFKKNCKTCHTEGAEGGAITPLSKTMAQWDRFFSEKKHPEGAWDDYNDKDLLDINQFLFDHAVDSDQPETCG
ncbi:c-type cytochrome [Malonomonas rubra]|uniref:c-type cytochrome n=1 Tax=Malonomonas rubra TaxID=57040 RepID=UPI0026F1ED43|nr:c-type cytochrome [Malonomonas rubra]